jgi:hypothetical protein
MPVIRPKSQFAGDLMRYLKFWESMKPRLKVMGVSSASHLTLLQYEKVGSK